MRGESFVVRAPLDRLLHHWRYSKAGCHITSGLVVCDLGCGQKADFLKRQEEKIARGFGLDLEVDKAVQTNKITLIAADFNRLLPLPDNSVDLVSSMAVLEHITNCGRHLQEIRRILKRGGKIVATTPSPLAKPVLELLCLLRLIDKREIEDHKRYFSKKQLQQLFQQTGFNLVTVSRFQLGMNQVVVAFK